MRRLSSSRPRSCTNFNPRIRVGCDILIRPNPENVLFQSTHPRGMRPALHAYYASGEVLFQSTHPRGMRPLQRLDFIPHVFPFQSTHPRGMRRIVFRDAQASSVISIHASAWDATEHEIDQIWAEAVISIHASAWDATSSRYSSVTPSQ